MDSAAIFGKSLGSKWPTISTYVSKSLLSQYAANLAILESHCYGHNLHLGPCSHKDLLPHTVRLHAPLSFQNIPRLDSPWITI